MHFHRRHFLTFAAASGATAFLPRVANAALPIEAYAALPMVDQIALSPDGTRIALISQNQDNKVLIHLNVSDQVTKTIPLGTVRTRKLMWADNDHVVIQTGHVRGERRRAEVGLVSVVNLSTLQQIMLFDKDSDRYFFHPTQAGWPQRVHTATGYQLIASTWSSRGRVVVQRFGMDDPAGTTVFEGSEYLSDCICAPDGQIIAIAEASATYGYWRLKFNRAAVGQPPRFEEVYAVNTHDLSPWPNLVGLDRSGKGLLLAMYSKDAGWFYHEMSPAGTLAPAFETGSGGDEISALFHPVTGRLAGYAVHDDWFRYEFFDPLMKSLAEAVPEVLGPGYRFSLIDHAEDPRKMIVYGEGPGDAGSYYYCDFATGNVFTIFSNYLDLDEAALSERKPIDYKAADGLDIHAYLTLPKARTAKDLPLVVLPHGGPESRDYGGFDWQAQALASRGYAVLQPNFRGSTGYGEAFLRAGDGEFGRKMQTDLSDGVRHLAAQGLIDPKRVAIMGASYGGYAALAGATIDKGVYRCAVSVAGICHPEWLVFGRMPGTYYHKIITRRLGDPERYDEISPFKRAREAYCPILLLHGTDDSVVPIDQSRRMEKALKAAGKPVEFISYRGQDHWETISSLRIEMMKAAVAFLEQHNPAG
ncbi:S9 family peptidase [Asticcacaulis sp. AC402]|uniref:alpha/beta hydrolase family protein n=1 Tax=Asticcacaulis sp. AC402 TaxID=1282361 RepID=UPI0003C3CA3C|nr:S9 family peptidase [Asticcacaulis sp. AC402]ESQ75134.1 hypothetical protein ABAC402_10725 [Asticcacaulis sp. AC402]